MFTRSNCTSWTTASAISLISATSRAAPFDPLPNAPGPRSTGLHRCSRRAVRWPLGPPIGPRSAIKSRRQPSSKSPAGQHPARSDVARLDSYLSFPKPAGRDPTPGKSARVPRISGQKPLFLNDKPRSARRGPPVAGSGARAMFLSNIYIKFHLAYNYLIKQYIIP